MPFSAFRSIARLGVIFSLGFVGATARADVHCAAIFGDHMVLQRDTPVPVWGQASPGETVTVSFADQRRQTNAGLDGRWQVVLAPLATSRDPRELLVTGNNRVAFTDVLVGEVWFCSGQSNMEKPIGPRVRQQPTDRYEQTLAEADHPLLRLFQVPRTDLPQTGPGVFTWLPSSGQALTVSDFSAAAYFFGADLVTQLEVPIGLIHSSFGGTRIEAWMLPAAFAANPVLRGLEYTRYFAWVPGVQPTDLYRTMVTPFVPFAIRGFIWYQGEQNVQNAGGSHYAAKMRELITSWRTAWGRPDAPFYYALVAPYDYSARDTISPRLTPEALPALWEDQLKALDVPATGIVITTDLVPDIHEIHPTNKHDVGGRFARLALAHVYGRSDVIAEGPRFESMQVNPDRTITLHFANADGLRSRDGQPLSDFAVAGDDHYFQPAEAKVAGSTVVVSCRGVSQPVSVRFGWRDTATPNLENSAGLPAEPFRTDDWPVRRALPVIPDQP